VVYKRVEGWTSGLLPRKKFCGKFRPLSVVGRVSLVSFHLFPLVEQKSMLIDYFKRNLIIHIRG